MRVVVTGMGIKSPAGNTVQDAYSTVLSGKPQAVHLPELLEAGLPVTFGCPVRGFEPEDYFTTVERRHLDRATQLGVAAAADAVTDAGGGFRGGERCGVFLGSGGANLASAVGLAREELRRLPVISVPMIMPNSTAARIAIRFGAQGPCLTYSTACASGTTAIGEAAAAIRAGRIDRAVAGGMDALLTPFFVAIFGRIGSLSRRNEAPEEACRPFDADRDGFVLGEGAACLTLEREDHAAARGARVYGTISGYAATTDAGHIVRPDSGGRAAVRAMSGALADAGLSPADIGHVNSHGSGTLVSDEAEAAALRTCFPGGTPPVAAIKGVTGYLLGGGGAVEAALTLLCARDGLVPPVAGFTGGPAAEGLDLVTGAPREIAEAPALSCSIGFGGHNAALALTP